MRKLFFIATLILFLFIGFSAQAETVGQKETFYIEPAYDSSGREELTAVLVKITPELYFYTDENWWNFTPQNEVYQTLSNLGEEFGDKIYPVLTSTFGSEWKPGIDKDSRVTILIHPMIKEAGGYFNPKDEYPKLQFTNSNEREMLYLNSEYIRTTYAKSFLAHEFVHLITFNQKERRYGVEEQVWLNEARADYAPTLIGYDDIYEGSNLERRVKIFLEGHSDSLTEWKNKNLDYGVANLFIQYLVDHYGVEILVDSLHTTTPGIISINDALEKNGLEVDFSQIFTDWTVASLINDCNLGPKYCYLNQNLKDLHIMPSINFLPTSGKSSLSVTDEIKNWSCNWYKIIGGKGKLKIEFTGYPTIVFKIPYLTKDSAGNYSLNFLELDRSQKGEMYVDEFGTEITTIIFNPLVQDRISGFSDNDPSYSFSWSASIVETQEEVELIKNLLAKIEFLKAEIAKVQAQIDAILAARGEKPSCQKFENNLYYGLMDNSEVRCLQEFLKSQGIEIYPDGLITGNFLSLTKAAVIRFQEKYTEDILVPWELTEGTGYVGPKTRAKINELMNQ